MRAERCISVLVDGVTREMGLPDDVVDSVKPLNQCVISVFNLARRDLARTISRGSAVPLHKLLRQKSD